MKRIKPLLVALVLCIITVVTGAYIAHHQVDRNNPEFGKYCSRNKFQSPELMGNSMNDHTLLLLGSSELHHQLNSKAHPGNVFTGSDISIMSYGAAYYQSLLQSITVASMDPYIKNRKVALIVSPQWFNKMGATPDAFSNNFSELHYKRFLANTKVGISVKEYVKNRTHQLLSVDPTELSAIKTMERVVIEGPKDTVKSATIGDLLDDKFREAFFSEKYKIATGLELKYYGIRKRPEPTSPAKYNWDKLEKIAIKSASKAVGDDTLLMKRSYFNSNIKPVMGRMKNAYTNYTFAESPEYKDLAAFLAVCKQCNVKPMLILIPVNGAWYDYTGFPKSGRTKCYDKIREMANQYNVRLADLSGNEYTKYFFEDAAHISWKGWVEVDKAIQSFVSEN